MGLTVAEVFILLAFILLLLLVYWKEEERREREICEKQAQACAAYPGLDLDAVAQFAELTQGRDGDDVIGALQKLAGGARLIEKQDLIALIDVIEGLPPVRRAEFIELVSAEDYQDVIEWARVLAELSADGYRPEDLIQLVQSLPADATDPSDVIDRVRSALRTASALGASIAGEVSRAVGDLVGGIGGTIDRTSGAVTLPDTALFDKGSSALSPQTQGFLDLFCVPWIETLSGFEGHIQALRIEGHASTEWDTSSDALEAFLKNLELSQARASVVLDYCLRQASRVGVGPWARARLVAVGYSSAKPILVDGVEDAVKSRRVVFRPEADSERILETIEREVAEP